MKITLVTVGKIKEKYLEAAIAEYSKRLGRYCRLEIVQVADEKTPDKASELQEAQIRDKEGERILPPVQTETELFEELILEIRGEGLCRVRPEDGFLATRAALAARESEDTGRNITVK